MLISPLCASSTVLQLRSEHVHATIIGEGCASNSVAAPKGDVFYAVCEFRRTKFPDLIDMDGFGCPFRQRSSGGVLDLYSVRA